MHTDHFLEPSLRKNGLCRPWERGIVRDTGKREKSISIYILFTKMQVSQSIPIDITLFFEVDESMPEYLSVWISIVCTFSLSIPLSGCWQDLEGNGVEQTSRLNYCRYARQLLAMLSGTERNRWVRLELSSALNLSRFRPLFAWVSYWYAPMRSKREKVHRLHSLAELSMILAIAFLNQPSWWGVNSWKLLTECCLRTSQFVD